MENIIQKYQLKDNRQLVIRYDEDGESPRERDNIGKLCIREHRRYTFPNELDFEWTIAGTNAIKLYEDYFVFEIDCYEHSGIAFSLAGRGQQCQFDTAKNCGFIAIPKIECDKEEDAQQIAKRELEIYNSYMNGEVYRFTTLTPKRWTNEAGDEKIEREFEDGC
jgi:hypothetical protein